MSTQMTVRLADESAAFVDKMVEAGEASSRASALDRLVRQEVRRRRAQQDALIYAQHGEDPELVEFTEAARASAREHDLDR
jgi:Arc/MetJ-type ribon-helix-helix transcriptional regulator